MRERPKNFLPSFFRRKIPREATADMPGAYAAVNADARAFTVTPPPIRETAIIDLSNRADTAKVDLPEKYRKHMGVREPIVAEDLAFFEDLVGNAQREETGETLSDEEVFFNAAKSIMEYADRLREETEASYPSITITTQDLEGPDANEIVKKHKLLESIRPSNDRLATITRLFLHTPQFRGTFLKLQAKKMELAFPDVVESMQQIQPTSIDSLDTYMNSVVTSMAYGMEEATYAFPPEQVSAVGFLVGLQEEGVYPHEATRRKIFAVKGLGTFSENVQKVIEEAIDGGTDIRENIRREFLERDGVSYQLMRIHLVDFIIKALPHAKGKTLDEQRAMIAEANYLPGTCPAIMKIPSADGSAMERPIAYEYAIAVADAIPAHLRQRDTQQEEVQGLITIEPANTNSLDSTLDSGSTITFVTDEAGARDDSDEHDDSRER